MDKVLICYFTIGIFYSLINLKEYFRTIKQNKEEYSNSRNFHDEIRLKVSSNILYKILLFVIFIVIYSMFYPIDIISRIKNNRKEDV